MVGMRLPKGDHPNAYGDNREPKARCSHVSSQHRRSEQEQGYGQPRKGEPHVPSFIDGV
jgi:hypothetical protein